MNRLTDTMGNLAAQGRKALVIYVTQGDPSPETTVDIVIRAAEAGADVIELGVPFSDPNADGPVIQAAMQRALRAGGGLSSALDTVEAIRARGCDVPIVLFGYYNPIFVYGLERFASRASSVGVDAVLTVDLPLEEIDELRTPLAAHDVAVVPLVAPTSGAERIARVRQFDAPFVYYISMTGITGASLATASVGARRIAQVRDATNAPVAVGFGIKTPTDAAAMGKHADGVVVGSAVVTCIVDAGPDAAADAVGTFVRSLRRGLDG